MNTKVLMVLAAVAVAGITACSSAGADKPHGDHPEWNRLTLTVGQQASGIVTLAKESGAFDDTSYKVKWALFPYGPPLVAAASSAQIDIGDVGNVPPITGAAKHLGFKIVAAEQQVDQKTQSADSLLVPKTSPIRTLRDLRGKKIAVPIGSSAHGFLLNAIQTAGLSPKDVTLVNLAPGQALPHSTAARSTPGRSGNHRYPSSKRAAPGYCWPATHPSTTAPASTSHPTSR